MSLLEVDPSVLRENFSEASFPVKHNLAGHPLLTLDRIGQLADSLPDSQVEHNLGNVPDVLPGGEAPRLDASPGEIARGIETNGCWMVLKRVNTDPEYKQLLADALNEVIPLVADTEGGATIQQGFIFLTAPNSNTPVHFDPEQNLLLQIMGPKEISVGDWPDHDTETHHIEQYYGGGHRNLESKPEQSTAYRMNPGDGVYVPLNAPHWVRTFDEPSISFSITFNTRYSESLTDIYSVNARMRRLGLSPHPPGEGAARDRTKAALWRSMRRGKGMAKIITRRNGRG